MQLNGNINQVFSDGGVSRCGRRGGIKWAEATFLDPRFLGLVLVVDHGRAERLILRIAGG